MGIVERKEREKDRRKALIMSCAKELILKCGAEKVSMQNIAEKTELSKATLYLYFRGKEELFREICNAAGRQFMDVFQSGLKPDQSGLEILRQFWISYVDFFGGSEDMFIIFSLKNYLAPGYPFLSVEEQNDPLILNEFYPILQDALARGIREGFFDPDMNTVTVSEAILSLFSNIVENTAKKPGETRNPKMMLEELRKLFQVILKGIVRHGLDQSLLELPGYQV